MQNTTTVLFALLRSAIKGEKVSEEERALCNAELFSSVFALAKQHDSAHLLVVGLEKNGLLGEINLPPQKLLQEQMRGVYRYEQQRYELEQICKTLEDAEISFIPLKGSVIRDYYPEPWMRTSCDIDILIEEKDIERASQSLEHALAYEIGDKGSHDVSFNAPCGVHLELHYTLTEKDSIGRGEELLDEAWNFSSPVEGKKYHRVLRDEMFYYYHVAHMAKHYLVGGCGLRPFIDLYILKQKNFLNEKTVALLQKGGLWKFAEQANALSEVWFGGAAHTPITQRMEEYLLKGGVYGNTSNRVAVQQVKKGGKIKYFWSRIFLPYDVIKFHYPILQKRRWLLPFMQVRRWFKLAFCGRAKRAMREFKINSNVSADESAQMQEFLDQIGL